MLVLDWVVGGARCCGLCWGRELELELGLGGAPVSFGGLEVDEDVRSGAILATPFILWRTSSDSFTPRRIRTLSSSSTPKDTFLVVLSPEPMPAGGK